MPFTVPEELYPVLMEHLKADIFPRAVVMMSILQQTIEGKLTAAFYTDKWPNILAVVCEIYSPRISDVADLTFYGTSNEAVLEMLAKGKFITWGQYQRIHSIEAKLADFVLENLKPPSGVSADIQCIYIGTVYYLPVSTKIELKPCPSGYTLGKLEPHHAEYVASHWNQHKDWPNRVSWIKEHIKNFESAAIFLDKDNSLVSWIIEYLGRRHSVLHTVEDHRKRGLATIVTTALTLCLQSKDNYLPVLALTNDGNPNNNILTKLGFIKTGLKVKTLSPEMIPRDVYPVLMEHLKADVFPRAVIMMSILQQTIEGKLTAAFYTDKWPNILAVVCEIYSPRISDVADLTLYGTSNEAVLQVLTEGKFITWGERQRIVCIEAELADFVLENLKPPSGVSTDIQCLYIGTVYYLPVSTKIELKSCPSGYTLGKLEPHHAEYVASHWDHHKDWPNRVSWFEERIKKFESAAIFLNKDNSLVSWNMQYEGGRHANLYTVEDHRKRGLATIVTTSLSLCLQSKDNSLPQLSITNDGNPNIKLLTKLGFINTGLKIKVLSIETN